MNPPILRTLMAASVVALGACSRPADAPSSRVVAVVKTVRADLVNTMTLQAEFEPFQDIQLHAKVSGYVNMIRVDLGDHVKVGDLIATLEVPELSDQLKSAVASEQRAQAESKIAHLNSTRLQDVNRSQPTLVAQQDLDEAAAKDSAQGAAAAAAEAEAGRYRTLMAYTRITAPFSGVITKRSADLGSLIGAGTSSSTEPLVELAQDDLLRLRFPVPEAEAPEIHAGEEVQISVGTVHRVFTGKIARDAWGIDRSTRTMMTEVDVPNSDGSLRAGMYASINLPLERAANALVVPLQALSADAQPSVMIVGTDGLVAEKKVSVGLRTASRVEIKSGLQEGDAVVVSDRGGLQAGDKVVTHEMEVPSEK
jgi:RND family efflux transporter MFP subunit